MNKPEFLTALEKGLSGLPKEEIDERILFYSEIIDDRMEDGLSQEEAVEEIGAVDEIVAQIKAETPLSVIVKERIKPSRKLKVWEIILLVLGSPLWLSLVIALVAVILSVYISLWAVIVSLWAVFGAMIVGSIGFIVSGIVFAFTSDIYVSLAIIGAGIVCAGITVFMFYGCKLSTKGIIILTKKIALMIKNCFIKKEVA